MKNAPQPTTQSTPQPAPVKQVEQLDLLYPPTPSVVVIFSGGLDSTVLLYRALEEFGAKQVHALSFDYGQRHFKELRCANDVIIKLPHVIPWQVVNLSSLQRAKIIKGSSQTGDLEVPYGHYNDDNMKTTVVPNRNMIMLSVAIAYAVSYEISNVWFGAHGGDHAIYPDCRQEFVEAMDKASQLGNWFPVQVSAPYLEDRMDKTDIVMLGARLKVPFELTWSCYEGQETHCGRCGTCVERREAFEQAGVKDPTYYASGEANEVDNTPAETL